MRQQAAPITTIPVWTLGDRLRKAREHADLLPHEMATKLDLSRNTVGRYESDRIVPKRSVILHWALITGVDSEWLERGEEARGRADRREGAGTRRQKVN